ncbi:alkaline phosphatase family protein, partial [bacterium]|nr:alkaline phosphatase family protein [candidate division CSSED10-310 bacterium]
MRAVSAEKLLVIGLDCADPVLLFQRWRDRLPFFSSLMDRGCYAEMRSTIPPITVPAWTAMMTSKDPGQLGIYGFRNRRSYDYDALSFATSRSVTHRRVWDILSAAGRRVVVVGVPQTYPPTAVNGCLISG